MPKTRYLVAGAGKLVKVESLAAAEMVKPDVEDGVIYVRQDVLAEMVDAMAKAIHAAGQIPVMVERQDGKWRCEHCAGPWSPLHTPIEHAPTCGHGVFSAAMFALPESAISALDRLRHLN